MAKEKKLFDTDSEDEKEYKPTKKVVESSEDEFSEEELDAKPVKKEANKIGAAKGEKRKQDDTIARDSNGNQFFELSAKRRVTVRTFPSGEANIDIREVYQDKNSGEMRPGKSGICLPIGQWNKLKELLPDIEEAVAALSNKKK